MEDVHKQCDCSAPYFKPGFDVYKNYFWKIEKPFSQENLETNMKTKKLCSFTTHAVCVAPILENFNYGTCKCPPRCNHLDTHHEAVQYGVRFKDPEMRDTVAYFKRN